MALAIDGSTPALASANSGSAATTASFTPPAGAVLVAIGYHDTASGNTTNASAITDSQSLTWTIRATRNKADSGGQNGHVQVSTAVVGSSTSMTVTTTGTNCAGAAGVYVLVITGADTTTPMDVTPTEGSNTAAAISLAITTATDLAWCFLAATDWNVAANMTAGTSQTAIVATGIGAGPDTRVYLGRQNATTSPAGPVTMSTASPTSGNTNNYIAFAVRPAAAAADVPYNGQRTVQLRDPGEVPWLQRERRDANLVSTAANDLAPPLLAPAGANTWHVVNDTATRDRRLVPQQRAYISDPSLHAAPDVPPAASRTLQIRDSGEGPWIQRRAQDPSLLTTAELENELLGGATTAQRASAAATNGPRWWAPQQPPREGFTPGLLDSAELEGALLAGDLRRHGHASLYTDRREMPQQRAYVSDPQLLSTALLENELLGGSSTAQRAGLPATNAARWWMPQQPPRVGSTPGLLDSALLEGPLLAGDLRRHGHAALYVDRREVPQQRAYISDPSFYPTIAPTDPLTVAWGNGGTYWLLYNTAALQVDRREVPQQRRYVSDPALLATALLEDALLGSADTSRHAMWFTDRREMPQQRVYVDPALLASALLEGVLLGSADTARHAMWFTDRRTVPQQSARAGVIDATTDPITLAAGVGGDLWRRVNLPAYGDRRVVPQQPARQTLYFDAGPGTAPLTLAWGVGGDLWHRYNPRRPARSWWPTVQVFAISCSCTTPRPTTGITARGSSGTTSRPNTGITEDPCC